MTHSHHVQDSRVWNLRHHAARVNEIFTNLSHSFNTISTDEQIHSGLKFNLARRGRIQYRQFMGAGGRESQAT